MPVKQQTTISHSEHAVTTSRSLVESLKGPQEVADSKKVEAEFGRMAAAIEALPPSQIDLSTLCYLRNRVRSSQSLWLNGERYQALYQVREMYRKLNRLS
jgi:hypothetical protein